MVIRVQKVPLQGFGKSVTPLGEELPVPLSAPAESVSAVFCNIKVNKGIIILFNVNRVKGVLLIFKVSEKLDIPL